MAARSTDFAVWSLLILVLPAAILLVALLLQVAEVKLGLLALGG